jgi:serine/threonine-protein kinase
MTGKRTDDNAQAESKPDSDGEFESWLRKGAHAPTHSLGPRLPAKGQVIGGKYRIEEELGAGGMGAVFRATHIVSDKAVALKWMLRPSSDERAVQRFTREARAAGRIAHPNVVDVYDIGHEGDASYLVMELLHGESFRKRLASGVLSPAEVVDLLLPAMRGVAAAHREGVIHRDLKPDNIFLCRGRNGEARPAKVLDFGISTITSPDLAIQTALTTEGTLLGTPSYMAPEQFEGTAVADVRTDIFAFGVILYEALTGRVPFKSDSYLGLALAIAKSDPIKPRELRPEIPSELQRVVLHAMHKDPNKRPQSIDEFVAALLPLASSAAGVPDSGEHASYERLKLNLPKRGSGRSRWVAATAVVGVVGIASLGWWWWTRSRQDGAMPAATAVQPTTSSAPSASPAPSTSSAPSTSPAPSASPAMLPQPSAATGGTPERSPTSAQPPVTKPTLPAVRTTRSSHGNGVTPRAHDPAPPSPAAKPAPAREPTESTTPARRSRTGAIRADEL